jgi:hypothetical protein
MTRRVRQLLLTLALLFCCVPASHAAIVWKVVLPTNCAGTSLLNFGSTMANFASTCCSSTASGGTNAYCQRADWYGDLVERYVEFAATGTCAGGANAGNICMVTGDCPASTCTITYTTGGDALASTEFKKIGLGVIVSGWCTSASSDKPLGLVIGAASGAQKGTQLSFKLFDESCPASGAGCSGANQPCPCCTGAGAGATCNGPQELASAAAVNGQTVQCFLRGFGA